jgi:DNA-binding winged helix-turn-helix (wHTH) protein/tetratricopeptide (TPR) repeat protein
MRRSRLRASLTKHMSNNNLCYEFGPYHLDPSKRILTREGDGIPLTPKATDILIALVKHAGQLIEKDELLKEVWPDTFVEEANLSQNVFTLRRALGDDRADPRYIETVAKRGYRFLATVTAVPPVGNVGPAVPSTEVASTSPVVAVLPFLNNTGNPDLEYLADGITSNIINNLSRISQLRVMSRSAVFRYKKTEVDLQQVGRELAVDAVLLGKINSWHSDLALTIELVNAPTGWQLWGATFNFESTNLSKTEDSIGRHVLAALKLQLSGEHEKHVTARYTHVAEAYDAYIEGRYNWSKYTRKGIEKAIRDFRRAIKLDPNYALAYAALVDCYLRLATNYLPPENDVVDLLVEEVYEAGAEFQDHNSKVKLRFEWDWKGAERELRRANELKTNYPAAHQWCAAYQMAQHIYEESRASQQPPNQRNTTYKRRNSSVLPHQIASIDLTPSEQVQVICTIAREQIDSGNHNAACKVLDSRWTFGDWPRLDGLNQQSCADLLFTVGELASYVANTTQIPRGQKHAEQLLNGSIALFEQLGLRRRAAEGRIELALCYYRQGLFDIGRSTLTRVLDQLSEESTELRGLALIRLATVERHAGRLQDALSKLIEAMPIVEVSGPWTSARCFLELASTYKDLAIAEALSTYSLQAKDFYIKALSQFEAVGHHRYVAVVQNNLGFLLLGAGLYKESEEHLLRSLRLFTVFCDDVAAAQVNETLARLYVETERYDLAREVVERAVKTLERTDGEALLAEAITTRGLVFIKQGRYNDAKKSFVAAYNIAERCGHNEGSGRALLIMLEELKDTLVAEEKIQLLGELEGLLASSQQKALQARVEKLIKSIAPFSNENN